MAHSAANLKANEPVANRAMRPIDLVHLAKQCLGDEQLEQEILRLFETTVEDYMLRLASAENDAAMMLCLHSIRGAASGVGAFAIADLARAAETDLQAGRPLESESLADLGLAVEEVRMFIGNLLSRKLD